jgi:adenylate kinase
MGKQASGKGTIIEELTRKHNLIPLSTGDLFREEFHKGTKLGMQLQKYMHEGELVPDDITIKILDCTEGTAATVHIGWDGRDRPIRYAQ